VDLQGSGVGEHVLEWRGTGAATEELGYIATGGTVPSTTTRLRRSCARVSGASVDGDPREMLRRSPFSNGEFSSAIASSCSSFAFERGQDRAFTGNGACSGQAECSVRLMIQEDGATGGAHSAATLCRDPASAIRDCRARDFFRGDRRFPARGLSKSGSSAHAHEM